MPVTVDLDVIALAGTRFAISPLSETILGLQQLGGRERHAGNLPWLRWAATELKAKPLYLPRTWPLIVNERTSWPHFLFPAPTGAAVSIDDELAAMRRTTARQVRASLRRVFGNDLPGSAADLARHPAAGLGEIAHELRQAHDQLIAPHWARIHAVLNADIAYRAQQLAEEGASGLFADLHPDLCWADGRLTIERDQRNRPIDTAARGLVLLPVVLGPHRVIVKGTTTTQTTLRYPARGTGALWSAGADPPSNDLVRLLGRPRAELLEQLRSPASTVQLARLSNVTPSAVSQHLAILRGNGLVAGQRTGRSVLYSTTKRGLDLLDHSASDD